MDNRRKYRVGMSTGVSPMLANGQTIDNMHIPACQNTVSEDANLSLSMVYSPFQVWQNLYDEETGLARGTIFKELDKPWCVGR